MKSQSIRVTSEQLAKLMADMYDPELDPAGEHLADEVIVNYTLQALTPVEVSRIDSHLAVCPDCAARTNHLLRASQAWRDEAGPAGLANLRERIMKKRSQIPANNVSAEPMGLSPGAKLASMLADLQTGWRNLFDQRQKSAPWSANVEGKKEQVIYDRTVELAGSSLRFHAVLSIKDELHCRFTSQDLDLEGQRIMFQLASFSKEVTLRRVLKNSIGASVVIPRYQLPDNLEALAELEWQLASAT